MQSLLLDRVAVSLHLRDRAHNSRRRQQFLPRSTVAILPHLLRRIPVQRIEVKVGLRVVENIRIRYEVQISVVVTANILPFFGSHDIGAVSVRLIETRPHLQGIFHSSHFIAFKSDIFT